MAQLGVQLLLFTLGLEFSLTKLRAVRAASMPQWLAHVAALGTSEGWIPWRPRTACVLLPCLQRLGCNSTGL